MPYEINWSHNQQLLITRAYGNVSVQEAVEMSAVATQRLQEGKPPIHFLVDITDIQKFPTNILQLKNTVGHLRHPHMGWLVVVGNNSLLNTLGTIISQLLGTNFRTFRTRKNALDFLEQVDPRLAASRENEHSTPIS
jgi:hypothetical protein